MNPPSPAPQRRRRTAPPGNPAANSSGQQTPELGELDLSANPARRRRTSEPKRETPDGRRHAAPARHPRAQKRSSRRNAPLAAFFAQLPPAVRMVLIALCALVFITCAAAITRNYLAAQEERRRLEAEAAERAQHPLVHADFITAYAAAQGLDPALVSAIILCESSYNPQAESYLGARGLMQLMEDTAGWIAHKLDEDGADYSFDLLYDPETNIRFGTWYLGYLSRRFGGDPVKIVCAYHAGQGNVDAWLKNPDYSRDGVTLDVIPTKDTAAYASRVLRARDVYRKYYFPVSPEAGAASP